MKEEGREDRRKQRMKRKKPKRGGESEKKESDCLSPPPNFSSSLISSYWYHPPFLSRSSFSLTSLSFISPCLSSLPLLPSYSPVSSPLFLFLLPPRLFFLYLLLSFVVILKLSGLIELSEFSSFQTPLISLHTSSPFLLPPSLHPSVSQLLLFCNLNNYFGSASQQFWMQDESAWITAWLCGCSIIKPSCTVTQICVDLFTHVECVSSAWYLFLFFVFFHETIYNSWGVFKELCLQEEPMSSDLRDTDSREGRNLVWFLWEKTWLSDISFKNQLIPTELCPCWKENHCRGKSNCKVCQTVKTSIIKESLKILRKPQSF